MKQIIRYQKTEVQARTKVINFVHTLTDKYDINPKDGGSSAWSPKVLKYLEEADIKFPRQIRAR